VLADDCLRQLCRLIPLFGVGRQRDAVLDAFAALTGESLAIEPWQRSPARSRINADGTPFQIALDLRAGASPALQFLGEAGRQEASAADRRTASLTALRTLGRLCHADDGAAAIAPLLDELVAVERGSAAPASLFWFALRFGAGVPPAVTVYVNGAWGSALETRRRFDRLAQAMTAGPRWRELRPVVESLTPLGLAITVRAGAVPSARVYLRGYGLRASWYRDALTRASASAAAGDAFDACAAALMGDAWSHPTQSVVLSADVGPDGAGAKVEFCGHCAFDDDAVAGARVERWLRAAGFDIGPYVRVVDAITGGQPVPPAGRRAALHAFAGVGVRATGPYASIYLNPGAVVGRT
jgi:hypothetical protein